MLNPTFLILFVDHPAASAAVYAALLGLPPVESSPTFVLFVLPSGLKLGLWSRHSAEPAPGPATGSSEIAFPVESETQLRQAHADMSARGLRILQPVTPMDFGLTFVAADPDGHRLRVFVLGRA